MSRKKYIFQLDDEWTPIDEFEPDKASSPVLKLPASWIRTDNTADNAASQIQPKPVKFMNWADSSRLNSGPHQEGYPLYDNEGESVQHWNENAIRNALEELESRKRSLSAREARLMRFPESWMQADNIADDGASQIQPKPVKFMDWTDPSRLNSGPHQEGYPLYDDEGESVQHWNENTIRNALEELESRKRSLPSHAAISEGIPQQTLPFHPSRFDNSNNRNTHWQNSPGPQRDNLSPDRRNNFPGHTLYYPAMLVPGLTFPGNNSKHNLSITPAYSDFSADLDTTLELPFGKKPDFNVGGGVNAKIGTPGLKYQIDGDGSKTTLVVNGPNAEVGAEANLNRSGVNISGKLGAYAADASVEREVYIPVTWLWNRWRALKKAFGRDKGEREEVGIVVGAKGSAGLGLGANAGIMAGQLKPNIYGARAFGKIGFGLSLGGGLYGGIKYKDETNRYINAPFDINNYKKLLLDRPPQDLPLWRRK